MRMRKMWISITRRLSFCSILRKVYEQSPSPETHTLVLSHLVLKSWSRDALQKNRREGCPSERQLQKRYKKCCGLYNLYILLLCEWLTNLELHLSPLLSPAPVSWGHPGSLQRRFHGENDTKERHLKLCFSSLASSHVSRRDFPTPATTQALNHKYPILVPGPNLQDSRYLVFSLSFICIWVCHACGYTWVVLFVCECIYMYAHTHGGSRLPSDFSVPPHLYWGRVKWIKPRADHFS